MKNLRYLFVIIMLLMIAALVIPILLFKDAQASGTEYEEGKVSAHCSQQAVEYAARSFEVYDLPTIGPFAPEIRQHLLDSLYHGCMVVQYQYLNNLPQLQQGLGVPHETENRPM